MTHPVRLRATFGALGLALLAGAIASPSLAQDITFKGRTVAINIGYGPGGGYDTYGRAFALHAQ